jgi:hypothetical protein
MMPPKNADVVETKTGYYWFEDGILCSVRKPDGPNLTPEERKREREEFINRYGMKQHCLLIDGKYIKPSTRQEREDAAAEMPKLVKALAIIVHNPMGRIVINLFMGLQKPPYPVKTFKPGEWQKAKEWLKQYM